MKKGPATDLSDFPGQAIDRYTMQCPFPGSPRLLAISQHPSAQADTYPWIGLHVRVEVEKLLIRLES